MATLAEFKTKLERLTATKDLDDDVIDDYIEAALMAFSEHQPERVKMKKVPVDPDANGLYDVPTDALNVARLFVYDTDIEISFEVERDSTTHARKIRVGSIERPQWLFVGAEYGPIDYGVNEQTFINSARGGVFEDYEYFDIDYFRLPTIERLSSHDLYTVQLFC